MSSNKDKIKNLLQSGERAHQIIAIQLMSNLGWSLDDCALFCFLNIKPKVSFDYQKNWHQSNYKVGNYNIQFCKVKIVDPREENRIIINMDSPCDEDFDYRCSLSRKVDNIKGRTAKVDLILDNIYPMELNPPVLEYFGTAVLLNLE